MALQRALKGDEKLLTETLRRFWPVLEKRELVLSENRERRDPPEVDDTDEMVAYAVRMLAALAEPVDDPEPSRR